MAVGVEQLQQVLQEQESPADKASRDAATISDLEGKYAMALTGARDSHRIWRENIAFLEGLQWLRNVTTLGLLNLQYVTRNRIRLTDNRLMDHARRLHARLSQVRYAPVVIAETSDPGDRRAARAAWAALRWFERLKKIPRHKRLAAWWVVACGQAYLEPYFDSSAGPIETAPQLDESGEPITEVVNGEDGMPVPEVGEDGNIQTGEDGMPIFQRRTVEASQPIGEVDFVVRSPFQVLRDPRFQEWEKLRWVIVEESAAREEVLERFKDIPGIEKGLPEGAKIKTADWIPDVPPGMPEETGIPRPLPGVTGIVQVKRYYERPSGQFPGGRQVIWTGEFVLYEGELGTPDNDFPLVPLMYLGRPWFLEGKSVVEGGKSLQRLYNRIFSRYAEHLVRLPAGWLMVPVTSGIPKRAFTSETGSIIRYAPGGGVPQFVFPPFQGLAWYDRFLARIETSMEERMALPPATRGQLPRGARAARTVELLQEAADQIQGPVLDDMADSWASFYEKVLGLMHKHYAVPRLVAALGDDKIADVYEFKGDVMPKDWRDRLSVKVESGESLPSTKLMRMELILTLASRHQMFGPPGTPDYVRNVRNALDIDAGFVPTDEDLDLALAEAENIRMQVGEQLVPNRYDNDEEHIKAHLQYVKRMLLAGKDDETMPYYQHIEAHKMSIAQKMGPALVDAGGGNSPEGPPGPGGPKKPGGEQPRAKQVEEIRPQPAADRVMGTDEGER